MALPADGRARSCAAGDLHGQFGDLQRIFQRLGRPGSDDKVWIFLGDYIDRGEGDEVTLVSEAGLFRTGRQSGRAAERAGLGGSRAITGRGTVSWRSGVQLLLLRMLCG